MWGHRFAMYQQDDLKIKNIKANTSQSDVSTVWVETWMSEVETLANQGFFHTFAFKIRNFLKSFLPIGLSFEDVVCLYNV